MRHTILLLQFISVIAMIAIIGCSSGKVTPVEPVSPDSQIPVASDNGNHELLGIWTAYIDVDSLTATVEPNREAMAHFNVKPYLPAPRITVKEWDPSKQLITVDVGVNNNSSLTGYDFRLIIFTDTVGHALMKPDNWTNLYDIPGGDNINPFRAYCKEMKHRVFETETSQTEEIIVKLPGGNPYVTFAMDASYPGNCVEPYSITSFTQEKLLSTTGSTASIGVDIFRWNQFSTVTASLFCTPLLTIEGSASFSFDTGDHYIGTLTNITGAPAGQYSGLIRAQTNLSPKTGLYRYVTITVSPVLEGWVRQIDYSVFFTPFVEIADSNLILVTSNLNYFEFNNEGDQVRTHALTDESDWNIVNDMYFDNVSGFVYFGGGGGLCGTGDTGLMNAQYDILQTEKWTNQKCIWDTESAYENAIAVDPYEYSYFAGNGPLGTNIWKLDKDGYESWYHTFTNNNSSFSIDDMLFQGTSALMGTGAFGGTVVNFDYAGGSSWNRFTSGLQDAYLAGWAQDGSTLYVATWGDSTGGDTRVYSRSIAMDSSYPNIYVIGDWNGQVDFDPSPGINNFTSNGASDIYVSKFNANGAYLGTLVITSTGDWDSGNAITTDPEDNILITGYFSGEADFNPTAGQFLVSSAGQTDAFVAKYTPSLDLVWVRTFGSTGGESGSDIACDILGNIYVTGNFRNTVDFDPGPEVVTLTADEDETSGFLLKLVSNGTWYR